MSLLVTSVILSGSFLLTIILQLLMNLQHPILLEKNDKNHHEYKKLERRSNLLEDHPKCGITTGGKEECWWSCTLVNPASPYPRYKDPLCLENCSIPCIQSLLADYKTAGGICAGSWQAVFRPGELPISATPCNMGIPDENGHRYPINQGPCLSDTESKLRTQECIDDVFSIKAGVFLTIRRLVRSICKTSVWRSFKPGRRINRVSEVDLNITETETEHNETILQSRNTTKLIPISEINEEYEPTLARVPHLENTKHRYSWLCSLRGKEDKKHYCGVTLLALPPSPTVVVGAAHCTFLCKSPHSSNILPNCCCDNVGGEICSDNPECEDDAETIDMTGNEAEIVCGEWETGTVSSEDSGELYNIILPIIRIVKHPKYHISRGELNSQYVADDIAVFKVDDKELKDTNHDIYPACLPKKNIEPEATYAIHSGWSHPPPLKFLEKSLPHYVDYYQDLQKQWHHNMSVTKCRDPDKDIISLSPLKYPTNSYYPPGTICARDVFDEFCPTSGESGSPLMTNIDGKFALTGVQSFTKGCSTFSYYSSPLFSQLFQQSINPFVYVKVSCYLAWIAEQYDMIFEESEDTDSDCIVGQGNIQESNDEVCRTNPSTYYSNSNDRIEPEPACIFPFQFDGKTWNECLMSGIEDFTHPVFRCPIRTLKSRESNYLSDNNGVNEALIGGYCPTNSIGNTFDGDHIVFTFNDDGPKYGPNGEYEVDPDNKNCGTFSRLPIFGTCKNNCPGVNFPVVSGGFALLKVASVVVPSSGVLPSTLLSTAVTFGPGVTTAGLLGGYSMASEHMCSGPFYCQSVSGECCQLVFYRGRLICPRSCNFAKRQSDFTEDGYSLLDIFQVTLVTALVTNSIFPNMSTRSIPTIPTTTVSTSTQTFTTATTTTTAAAATPAYVAEDPSVLISDLANLCPTGWKYYHTEMCYKYFSQKMNWYESASHCRDEKATLASVPDSSTNKFVTRLGSSSFWVGGHRSSSNYYIWEWNDGSPWQYTNWNEGEPNNYFELCVEVYSSGLSRYRWNDQPCPHEQGFVCQRPVVYGSNDQVSCNDIDECAITSPNYPSNYPNREEKIFRLEVPSGYRIVLTFTDFTLERCPYDKVIDSTGKILERCGTELPPPVTSSSNIMTVTFTSDSSVTKRGFKAIIDFLK